MKTVGIWSFLGTIGLIVIATLYFGVDYGAIWHEFIVFIFGGVNQVIRGYDNLLDAFGVIGAIVVIDIALSVCIGFFVQLIKGKAEHIFDFLNIGEGYHTMTHFLIVLLEEFFARWLFLGVLAHVFTGTLAFYILIFVGNSIWAFVHITNYKKKDQSVLRVLPQFIGGFFLSFIYVKYGLVITVLTHFTFNAVIFATIKKQNVGKRDLGLLLYYGVGFGIAWLLLSIRGIGFDAVAPWFIVNEVLLPLKGFKFWDYLLIFIALSFAFDFLVSILLFDHTTTIKEGESNYTGAILWGPLVVVGLIYLVNWLAGIFTSLVILKTLIVAIILLLLTKSPSMSGMSRSWFANLIPNYLLVCVINTLNFWPAIGLCSFLLVTGYIPYKLTTKVAQ